MPRAEATWMVVLLGLCVLAWHQILGTYFFADDFLGLYALANRGAWPFVAEPHGGHLLLLRNTAFWLCWRAFGSDPTGYFATALATHLLNAVLLFVLLRRVVANGTVAGAVAALWAVAPAHDGSLAWYAVYGHMLATTFVLLLLLDVARWHDAGTELSPGRGAWWCVLLVAAGVSYGVGLGVAAAAPLGLALLVPRVRRRRLALAIVAVAPVALALAWLAIAPASAGMAPADGSEGLARAISRPLANPAAILSLGGMLVAYGLGNLLLGPWARWLAHPDTTTLIVGGLATVILIVAVLRSPTPRLRSAMLGTLLLALAAYGSVAAARAAVYEMISVSTAFAAALHRYHYLGQTMLAVAVGAGVMVLLPERLLAAYRGGVAGLVVLLLGLPLLLVPYAVDLHADVRTQAAKELRRLALTIAATPAGEEARLRNRAFGPMQPVVLLTGPAHLPGLAAGFIVYFPSNTVDGRRVRFVANSDKEYSATAGGGRIAEVLLPPPVPATPPGNGTSPESGS